MSTPWARVGAPSAADAALFGEAREAWNRGEGESILPRLAQALPGSGDYRLWHIHGLILRQLDRRSEALESLARAVQLAPSAANPAHAYARTLHEAGLPSVNAFAAALRLAPGDPEVVLGMAAALAGERRIDDAIAGLERSVSLTPAWVQGHLYLSQLRWLRGEREGFTRSFDEALAKIPLDLNLRREQIVALIHAEQWDATLRVIAEGRAAVGDNSIFDANEAAVWAEVGETELADMAFARLAALPDATVQVRRVRHLLRTGRVDEARIAIDPWLDAPDALLFWPYASVAWRLAGDPRWDWLEGDSSLVGVYDIADQLPPLDELAETLRRIHDSCGQPLEQSVRGGTQTDGNLFERIEPMIIAVREAVRQTVAQHAAQLPPPDDRHPLLRPPRSPIRFSGAWSVRLNSGGFHTSLVHIYGWISSALYVVLPDGLGENDAGVLTIGEPESRLQVDLPPTRIVEPKPGRLVLFPSWMWHGTRPFPDGERMTIAFDVAVAE